MRAAKQSTYGQLNQQKKTFKASMFDTDDSTQVVIRDYAKEERATGAVATGPEVV